MSGLWLPLIKEGKVQEPWAHIPHSDNLLGLSSSYLLWSEPGQFFSLPQAAPLPMALSRSVYPSLLPTWPL